MKWTKRVNFLVAYLNVSSNKAVDPFISDLILNNVDDIDDIYTYSIALKRIINGDKSIENIDMLFDSLTKRH